MGSQSSLCTFLPSLAIQVSLPSLGSQIHLLKSDRPLTRVNIWRHSAGSEMHSLSQIYTQSQGGDTHP